MATFVRLAVSNNQGYTPDQVENSMTLQDLYRQLEEAIDLYGPDARIITYDRDNRYGASYGGIDSGADTFEAFDADDSDEEDDFV